MSALDEQLLRDVYELRFLLGDKWSLAIMVALSDGPMRRAKLLSTVNSYAFNEERFGKRARLHDSILAKELKKLTGRGLLVRTTEEKSFPPRVYYSLAPEVVELLELTGDLSLWLRQHADLVARAHDRHPA